MMKGVLLVLLLALSASLAPGAARADTLDQHVARVIDSDTMRLAAEAARRGWVRFRRSVTLGPTLSAGPSLNLEGEVAARAYVGGGVALLVYDIPVIPTSDELRAMALRTVIDTVKAQVDAAQARGELISEEDRKRLALEAWQRLKDRLLLGMTPRRLEKPSFAAIAEFGHRIDTNNWDVRGMVGLGLGPVLASVGASLLIDLDLALVIPLELSVPVLVSDGLRSPVVQVFARGELPVTGGEDEVRRLVVGARFALDVL
jgi:hypothetical protein